MSSWVLCVCGQKLNKNLFAGNQWQILVPEESIDKDTVTDSDLNCIIVKSKISKNCPECGCLVVVDDQNNKVKYYKEQVV